MKIINPVTYKFSTMIRNNLTVIIIDMNALSSIAVVDLLN